jgi:hypothetical protein
VPAALYLTPDDDANRLLAHNPLATLIVHVVDEYDGHPERMWTEARDGDDWRQHSHAGGLECRNWRGC